MSCGGTCSPRSAPGTELAKRRSDRECQEREVTAMMRLDTNPTTPGLRAGRVQADAMAVLIQVPRVTSRVGAAGSGGRRTGHGRPRAGPSDSSAGPSGPRPSAAAAPSRGPTWPAWSLLVLALDGRHVHDGLDDPRRRIPRACPLFGRSRSARGAGTGLRLGRGRAAIGCRAASRTGGRRRRDRAGARRPGRRRGGPRGLPGIRAARQQSRGAGA